MDSPLVCIRASKLPRPPTASHRDNCSLCGSTVIVADSSPDIKTIWCWECAGVQIEAAHATGEKVMVERPTPTQLADLAQHWNKR